MPGTQQDGLGPRISLFLFQPKIESDAYLGNSLLCLVDRPPEEY